MILFSVEIKKTSFESKELLETLCQEVEHLPMTQSHSALRGNTTSSYSKNSERLHQLPVFADLVEFIETQAKIYWDELGYYPDLYPKIYQSWITKYHHGGFIDKHDHIPASLSGVLYLSASPEQGNLVFENPLELWLRTQPYSADKRKGSFFEREIPVTTGDLIMFPAYLRHYTLPNRSQKDRIIMSFNLNSTGQFDNPYV